MTGSSSGKSCLNFDNYKHQEWIRRRKFRIEQVRKQSKEIAKALRQKVENEEKIRSKEFGKEEETKFKCWRAGKLDEMERKLRNALEEFGLGHKLAEIEPDPEEIIETKKRHNHKKAQERGILATQEEQRRKKLERQKKLSPMQKKKVTRKLEDLRSALVCSVSNNRQLLEDNYDFSQPEAEHLKQKNITAKKKCKSVNDQHESEQNIATAASKKNYKNTLVLESSEQSYMKPSANAFQKEKKSFIIEHLQNDTTTWINLNDIQNLSATESGTNSRSRKSLSSRCSNNVEKQDKSVEFYDYHSRYACKSFRDYGDLVEKHELNCRPHSDNLIENEKELQKVETEKKHKAIIACKERGIKALQREKINQEYNNLISKLEQLHKKEKIIKAQIQPPMVEMYMTDERLSERLKTRQQIMNSKFESIYSKATGGILPKDSRAGIQMENFQEPNPSEQNVISASEISAELDLSPENRKTNSPVVSNYEEQECRVESCSVPLIQKKRKKKKNFKKKLLSDIDSALLEGRKLREAITHSSEKIWVDTSNIGEKSKSTTELNSCQEAITTEKLIQSKDEPIISKNVQSQASQTEEFGTKCNLLHDAMLTNYFEGISIQMENDSLPISSSTSYKSPPSEICCDDLREVLDCLDINGNNSETHSLKNSKKYKNHMFQDIIGKEIVSSTKVKSISSASNNPTLEYYISKLLMMSRECVASLSVSSENISIDGDGNNDRPISKSDSESMYSCRSSPNSEISSHLQLTKNLDESLQPWENLLGKLVKQSSYPHSFHESVEAVEKQSKYSADTDFNEIQEHAVIYSPKIKSKYDKITKKCSERINELSNLLNKVRHDKENFLNTGSGISSRTLGSSEQILQKKLYNDSVGETRPILVDKNWSSRVFENLTNRYTLQLSHKNNVSPPSEIDSQTAHDYNDSSTCETLPDVMDELLKREIISSPFKWCEGNFSDLDIADESPHESQPTQTALYNFQKVMSKIKPCTSIHSSSSPKLLKYYIKNDNKDIVQTDCMNFLSECELDQIDEMDEYFPSNIQESSMESTNKALTCLGHNWTKTFLKKSDEIKAISSSSYSDEKVFCRLKKN